MATFPHDLPAASAVTSRALPVLAVLLGSGCNSLAAASPPVATDLNGPADGFEVSDGWVNHEMNGCGWRRDNARFEDGMLTLSIDDRRSRGRDFSCGEYRTRGYYSFGYYETRMRAGAAEGVVTAFFTYTGPPFGDPHDEIDFEWLGSDTTEVQVNYFVDGRGHHEHMIDLGFDAADDFHVYGFEWRPNLVRWYVDCQLVHEVSRPEGGLPRTPGRIYVHLWNGSEIVNDWLGEFEYDGRPVRSVFDYIRHTPGGIHDEASSCAGGRPVEAMDEGDQMDPEAAGGSYEAVALPTALSPAAPEPSRVDEPGEVARPKGASDADTPPDVAAPSGPLEGGAAQVDRPDPAQPAPVEEHAAAEQAAAADPVVESAGPSDRPIPLGAFGSERR